MAQTYETYIIDGTVTSSPPLTEHLKLGAAEDGCSPQGVQIEVNSRYLLKGGQPWIPVMGEFHFSRYPRKYWQEALLKMKAAGISVVATYIFWIHHEEIEGEWNWSGNCALRNLADMCVQHNLYFYPRIGPWVHGECRNGGFPDWLLQKCPVVRADDPLYLDYVEKFYRQIYQQLTGYFFKEGGPIIGIQLENEYGHVGDEGDAEHILTLKAMARQIGFEVPLYTVTGWGGAWVPENEVLPVLGGYPSAPWANHTRQLPPVNIYLFQAYAQDANIGSDLAVEILRDTRFDPKLYPYMTCETGGGNQVTDHRRPLLTVNDIAAIPVAQLGSGVNLPGYYVFHGGTNPVGKLSTFQESRETGYPNNLPVLSYDFQAPIREYGQLNESYRLLKNIHLFLADFGDILAPMIPVFPPNLPQDAADADTLRYTIRVDNGRGFLFVNNHHRHVAMKAHENVEIRVELADEDIVYPAFAVAASAHFIWPFNLDLSGIKLKFAQAQLLCHVEADNTETYVFAATPGVTPRYCFEAATVHHQHIINGNVNDTTGELTISNVQPGTDAVIRLESRAGKQIQLLTLTHEQALNLWKGDFARKKRLVLTKSGVMFNQGALTLTGNQAEQYVGVYPPPENGLTYQGNRLSGEDDGIFTSYVLQQPSHGIEIQIEADSSQEYTWLIHLPEDMLTRINDVFLRFSIDCDKAYLYVDNTLIANHFYNGEVWEVGLKRFTGLIKSRPLKLVLEPLHEDADIYLDYRPHFTNGLAATLYSVEILPQYQFDDIAG
jgi:hypothetical protein